MEMNYSSNAKGTAALTTGIIGSALGVLNGAGGLIGIHGNTDYVSKETNDLQVKLIQSEMARSVLQSDLDSEKKMVSIFDSLNDKIVNTRSELQEQIRAVDSKLDNNVAAQSVINANVGSQIAVNTSKIAQLFGMTQLTIPNGSIMPGWGGVQISPAYNPNGTTIS